MDFGTWHLWPFGLTPSTWYLCRNVRTWLRTVLVLDPLHPTVRADAACARGRRLMLHRRPVLVVVGRLVRSGRRGRRFVQRRTGRRARGRRHGRGRWVVGRDGLQGGRGSRARGLLVRLRRRRQRRVVRVMVHHLVRIRRPTLVVHDRGPRGVTRDTVGRLVVMVVVQQWLWRHHHWESMGVVQVVVFLLLLLLVLLLVVLLLLLLLLVLLVLLVLLQMMAVMMVVAGGHGRRLVVAIRRRPRAGGLCWFRDGALVTVAVVAVRRRALQLSGAHGHGLVHGAIVVASVDQWCGGTHVVAHGGSMTSMTVTYHGSSRCCCDNDGGAGSRRMARTITRRRMRSTRTTTVVGAAVPVGRARRTT